MPDSLVTDATIIRTWSSFSSDVELDGTRLDGFFCSGSDVVLTVF